MKIIQVDVANSRATVELGHDELRTLGNALNEVLNGIGLPHFSTRIGVEEAEAGQLLNHLRELLHRFPRPDW